MIVPSLFLNFLSVGVRCEAEAEIPLANLHDYATALKAMSSGRGMFNLEFSHYQDMPHVEQQKVISDYEASRIEE